MCSDFATHTCGECNYEVMCTDCCQKMHRHPKRAHHSPVLISESAEFASQSASNTQSSSPSVQPPRPTDDNHSSWELSDEEITPSLEESFTHAAKIATLAERFNLTKFKDYQRKAIDAVLSGQDVIVVQPTGSGKSLCFQFPAVHENKKTIVVTPTISLM